MVMCQPNKRRTHKLNTKSKLRVAAYCRVSTDKDDQTNSLISQRKYFADYITTVEFISMEEFEKNHQGIPHGGSVIRTGKTGKNNICGVEFSLKLDSNPEFTGSVLVSFARAAARLNSEGVTGAKTVFDIAPAYLHPESAEYLRKNLL